MKLSTYCKPLISSTIILCTAACGSSGGGNSTPEQIKLSGPVTLSTVSEDATTSDGTVSVADTMSSFPADILNDFATRFPSIPADEQYRKLSYSAGIITEERFGVEGESAADTEVRAEYTAAGNFLSSESTTEGATVPANVTSTLSALYPGWTFEEVEIRTDNNGAITYEVEVENDESDESDENEVELILDETGTLLKTSEEIAASAVPAVVLSKIQLELQGLSKIEYEKITDNLSDSISYEGELETETESVSIHCDENGEIISIEYEIDL